MAADRPPLTIWAVSDGRTGIEAQALGLGEAVARLTGGELVTKRLRWKGAVGRLPTSLNPGWPRLLAPESGIAPPWPDIWIGAGRAALPLSRRVKRWSAGRTFVVQTQNPRGKLAPFDLVVPPVHDQLAGDNVFPIQGAPNRVTPQRLAEEAAHWRERLADLPQPRIAVIVGGKSKAFDLPPVRAASLAEEIEGAVAAAGGSLMLSFSRRTPKAARQVIERQLADTPGLIWDDRGENPYWAFLAMADAILITEDSTNLATDAAATGKPVYVLSLPGSSAKFRRFHEALEARGVSRRFEGVFETWDYPPLDETRRAAEEVVRRFEARRASAPISAERKA